jgi:hypothetical protein
VAAAGSAVEARGEEESRKRKFGPIWMIPHLVKGLRFLQTKILQVRETEDRQTLFLCCGSTLVSMGIRFQHFRSLRIRIQFRIQIQNCDDQILLNFTYLKKNQIVILLYVHLDFKQPSK